MIQKFVVDDTPLTRADIPKIVDAILSNFSNQGASSWNDSQVDNQDNSHVGE